MHPLQIQHISSATNPNMLNSVKYHTQLTPPMLPTFPRTPHHAACELGYGNRFSSAYCSKCHKGENSCDDPMFTPHSSSGGGNSWPLSGAAKTKPAPAK